MPPQLEIMRLEFVAGQMTKSKVYKIAAFYWN